MQNRLPGENLQSIVNQLNAAQPKDLACKMCRGILEMHDSPYGDRASVSTDGFASSMFEMRSLSIALDPFNDGKVYPLPVDGTGDTLTFIEMSCQRWKDHEGTFLRKRRAGRDPSVKMAQEMADRGFLRVSERFHFILMDTYPRNVFLTLPTTALSSLRSSRLGRRTTYFKKRLEVRIQGEVHSASTPVRHHADWTRVKSFLKGTWCHPRPLGGTEEDARF